MLNTTEILPKNPIPFDVNGCFVAGGAILSIVTGTEINDYDIYPKSKTDFENILIDLIEKEDCYIINISDRAVTLKSRKHKNHLNEEYTIQVIFFKFQNTSEALFNTFDFTVCMAAFDCDTLTYSFHPNFYQDVASRTLRYNENALFPISSFLRVKKYREKGYELGKICNIKLAVSLMNRGMPNSWKDLQDEIGGLYGNNTYIDNNIEFSYDNLMLFLDSMYGENLTNNTNNIETKKTYEILNNNGHKDEIEYFKINDNDVVLVEKNKLKETVPISFINNIGEKLKLKDISDHKDTKFFGYVPSYDTMTVFGFPHVFTYVDIFKNKQKAIENMESNYVLYVVKLSAKDIIKPDQDTVRFRKALAVTKVPSLQGSMDDDILEAYAKIMEI